MSILDKISEEFELVTSGTKSSDIEIDELIKFSRIDIPCEFLDIIKEKSEIEIWVNKEKYVRLWGAKGCIEMNDAYHIQQYIPESLAIGDDECSNALLYANGNRGVGVYIVSFGNLDIDEMVYIADSLEAFFVNKEGIHIFNNVW
jgi:hypothetical protein